MNAPAARHTGGLASGAKAAILDRGVLHRSLVEGIAAGLRDGVHVASLDGYAAYTSLSHLTVVPERQARLAQLTGDRDRDRQLAARARALATQEEDEEVAEGYRQDARTHAASARRRQAEIDRLTHLSQTSAVPDQFDGEVDYLLAGLTSLLVEDGKLDRDQRAALRTVLRDLTLRPDDDQWRWSVHVLVPADGRVLRLGPFTGVVAARGRGLTAADKAAIATGGVNGHARRSRIHDLMTAGYPDHLARAATLAPWPQLVDALLGADDVVWPGCPDDYDHDAWTRHVRDAWGGHPGWARGVYAQTAPARQRLVDLVAALGGRASLADLDPYLPQIEMKRNDIYTVTLPKHGRRPDTPPWPPSLQRQGTWSAGTPATGSVLTTWTCPRCGHPATAVVRVLEVPDAIICTRCRVMPSRPDLVIPGCYLDLVTPVSPPPQITNPATSPLTPGP